MRIVPAPTTAISTTPAGPGDAIKCRASAPVKLFAQEGELYVLAQSRDRVEGAGDTAAPVEAAGARLKQLSTMQLTREELLMKLGAARDPSRIAWRLAVSTCGKSRVTSPQGGRPLSGRDFV